MNIEVLAVRDPVWSNAQNTQIDCMVRVSTDAEELPFTASPNDVEKHGRQIFHRCISGEFGEIGPYVAPTYTGDDDMSVSLPDWVSVWPEVHDFLIEANAENARGTLRGIGLVWGAMLDIMLKKFIQGELAQYGRSLRSLKQNGGKKCGDNFNDRIEGAIFEKMIDQAIGEHLHAIRHIRNACAHEWKLNYENPKVRGLAEHFSILKSAYYRSFQHDDLESMTKMVFSSACCQIIIHLAEQMVLRNPVTNPQSFHPAGPEES